MASFCGRVAVRALAPGVAVEGGQAGLRRDTLRLDFVNLPLLAAAALVFVTVPCAGDSLNSGAGRLSVSSPFNGAASHRAHPRRQGLPLDVNRQELVS